MYFRLLFSCIVLCTYSAQSQTLSGNTRFGEITSLIKENYKDAVNIDSVVNQMVNDYLNDTAAIRELLRRLDPFSEYLDEITYREMKTNLAGSFYGTGINMAIINDTVIVIAVYTHGPAEKAGLKAGDKIMKADDVLLSGAGAEYAKVIGALRGPKGTTVKMTVMRNNSPPLIDLFAVRDKISVRSVPAAYMLDKKTGYISISNFSDSTLKEVQKALTKLKAAGMKKLLLDLRNNTGGYLNKATGVADEFLPANTLLVYTEGQPGTRKDYMTETEGLFEKGKMVVLINSNTVSSGEILCGALQDNKRALFVGDRTFGKGLVQRLFPLGDSSVALKLTTAKYYTPSGKCIQQPYSGSEFLYRRENEMIFSKQDSSRKNLTTSKDMTWGITPDVFVAEDTSAAKDFFTMLESRSYISDFSYLYYSNHTVYIASYKSFGDFNSHFTMDDGLFSNLRKYVAHRENAPDTYYPELHYSENDFNTSKSKIETAFKAYIAKEHWGDDSYYQLINTLDPAMLTAIKVLNGTR